MRRTECGNTGEFPGACRGATYRSFDVVPVRRFLPNVIDLVRDDQPRQVLDSTFARPGGSRLPRNGRAARDLDPVAALTHFQET
jgi:hypothetical protein